MNKKQTNSSFDVSEKDVFDYILEKFQRVKKTKNITNLIEFHTKNKYMIMAHSQAELKTLGNLVANHKKINLEDTIAHYESYLRSALRKEPTMNSHLNVLMHIFGYFARNFNQNEKDEFMEIIRQYKKEKTAIGKILAEIEPTIYKFDNTYLASQTYFLLYANMQSELSFFVSRKNKS